MKYLNTAIGVILGALIWALSPRLTGLREPWDGAFAYYFGSLFLAGLVSALPCPRHWWKGTIGVYLGQYAFMFIVYGLGNLWPLSLLIGGVFMVVSLLGGAIVFALWFLFLKGKQRRIIEQSPAGDSKTRADGAASGTPEE